jgi:hypothetical protein
VALPVAAGAPVSPWEVQRRSPRALPMLCGDPSSDGHVLRLLPTRHLLHPPCPKHGGATRRRGVGGRPAAARGPGREARQEEVRTQEGQRRTVESRKREREEDGPHMRRVVETNGGGTHTSMVLRQNHRGAEPCPTTLPLGSF